ncbi:MAG: GTP-binding protein [Candidatus Heimdallarchaeota archaeon]|nr:MAG: GTP-binding protein [Candidatus Heimdallarchaeota archaeon]
MYKRGSEEIYSVVLLGTSGVGKSTIAFYLEHGYPPPRNIKPTIAFGITHIVIENAVIGLIDVGGQRKFLDMRYHERFVRTADGLVFVVDSSRNDFRYDEQWLEDALELVSKHTPILVIANKQDLPGALSPEFLKTQLFDKILRKYRIFGTVAADPGGLRSGENIMVAFQTLLSQMEVKRKVLVKHNQI